MAKRKTRRVALDLRGLSGREELFRLSGAVKRDPAVERWLTSGPSELKSIAQSWCTRIRECGADVRELMHDGCPTACVEDAAFAYVNTFKAHVNVGFFCGALLADPAGLLEGSGKRMRHVKLTPDSEPNAAALGELIDAAYRDIKVRLAAAENARKRKTGARGSRRESKRSTASADVLREIALQFDGVEDATTDRGIAFKARGRLLTCSAIHASAAPNSVVIRIGAEQRARLMKAYPDALYLTEHYEKHPAVLARLERLDRDSLRDILGAAWLFVTEKALTRKRSGSPRKR